MATVAVCVLAQGASPQPITGGGAVAAIPGAIDYFAAAPGSLTNGHVGGLIAYAQSPPVGGDHNFRWQTCMGNVYDAPVANEHAVHSLEHGAVWITYRTGLDSSEVALLAQRVRDIPFMLMSPMDDQGPAISLQAWGYQLQVDAAGDSRIDDFIRATRMAAATEAGASCANGISETGTNPH